MPTPEDKANIDRLLAKTSWTVRNQSDADILAYCDIAIRNSTWTRSRLTMMTEADTCRKYVPPKLYAVSWNHDQMDEPKSFMDGRIVLMGNWARRPPSKRADYLIGHRSVRRYYGSGNLSDFLHPLSCGRDSVPPKR
jgi:hypothetical protein